MFNLKKIAKELNIKMPSVTAALNKLKDLKLIEYEKYGYIELTVKGKEIAELVLDGERSTWPQLERLRICTKIGRTLDAILDDHAQHSVQHLYKKAAKR